MLKTASIVFLGSSISRCRCYMAKDTRHRFGFKKKFSRTLTTTASSPSAPKTPPRQLTAASLLVNPSNSGTVDLSSGNTHIHFPYQIHTCRPTHPTGMPPRSKRQSPLPSFDPRQQLPQPTPCHLSQVLRRSSTICPCRRWRTLRFGQRRT